MPLSTRLIAFGALVTGWFFAYGSSFKQLWALGSMPLGVLLIVAGGYTLRKDPKMSAHVACALVSGLLFGAVMAVMISPVFESLARARGLQPGVHFEFWRGLLSLGQSVYLGCTLIAPCHVLLGGRRLSVRLLCLTGGVALPCAVALAASLEWRGVHWPLLPSALGLTFVAVALAEMSRSFIARATSLRVSLVTRKPVSLSRAYLPRDSARRVGLALSGGGYRATLFGLGAAMYVHDVCADPAQPLRHVLAVSSVSGGSVTNGALAHGVRFGRDDCETFNRVARRIIRHATGSGSMFRVGLAPMYYSLLLLAVVLAPFLIWVMVSRLTLDIAWRAAVMPLSVVALTLAYGFALGLADRVRVRWLWLENLLALTVIAGFLAAVGWLLHVFLSRDEWRRALVWFDVALLPLAGAVILWSMRGGLIQETFDLLLRDGGVSPLLADAHADTHHVFCSTEVQLGHTVFFAHDAIRVRGLKDVRPDRLPTAMAVRASAALPVAFPPVVLGGFEEDHSAFGLRGEDTFWWRRPSHLVLVDGGVRDNLGTAWFDVAPSVDELIVVSAAANRHDGRKILQLPGLTEALALFNIVNIPYNTRERGNRRSVARQVLSVPWNQASASGGAVVHIEDSPYDLALKIVEKSEGGKPAGPWVDGQPGWEIDVSLAAEHKGKPAGLWMYSTARPDWEIDVSLAAEHLWAAAGPAKAVLVERARAVLMHLDSMEKELPEAPEPPFVGPVTTDGKYGTESPWWKRARQSAIVGTKLSRLKWGEAANLVIHGYYLAMANLHLCAGWPLRSDLGRERLVSLFGDVPLFPDRSNPSVTQL